MRDSNWKAEIDSQSRFITTEDGRRITRWRCDCCGAEDAELDWDSSEILGRPAAYCMGGCDGSDDEVIPFGASESAQEVVDEWPLFDRPFRRANMASLIGAFQRVARRRPVSLAIAIRWAKYARVLDRALARESRRTAQQWDGMPDEGGDDECPF